MVNCGACGKFLPATGVAACSLCPLKFHKACLAVPDKAHISKDWACPACKKNTRKGDNSHTPVKGICGTPPSAPVSPQSGASAEASSEREDRRDRELAGFMAEMREFRQEMRQLCESLSARLDSVEGRLEALERRDADAGPAGAEHLERTIAELKRELNDRDQDALLSDLEIGQLPEESGVSVVQSVTVLAARLGVTLEDRDVVFAERVGAPPAEGGRARRVVVRLARRHLRDELLRAARVRRAGLAAGSPVRVYLNERLTRPNRQIFHRVREECRRLQWRYAWTRRGRIFARQSEGSQVHQLRSENDIDRVFGVTKS
jgi:hypothetical protein